MTEGLTQISRPNSTPLQMAWSWAMSSHGRVMSQLWTLSVSIAALNALSTILIVARSTASVFAAYTVALSTMTIAAALMDGGLAGTFGVLGADSSLKGRRFRTFLVLFDEYRPKVLLIGLAASVALSVWVGGRSAAVQEHGQWWGVLAFTLLGVVVSRTSQTTALLYARGRFDDYWRVLLVPALLRVCGIGIWIVVVGRFSLGSLFLAVLTSSIAASVMSARAMRRERMAGGPSLAPEQTDRREAAMFFRPTAAATILTGLTFHVTAVGGSFYAGGQAVATYGVFMRFNQLISVVFAPASQYIGRHLRLTDDGKARDLTENSYLAAVLVGFSLYAFTTLFVYRSLSQRYTHFALGWTSEYALFLTYAGLSCWQLALDGILAARGVVRQRVPGTFVLFMLNAVLLPIVRPVTLEAMVLIDVASMMAIVAYYFYEFHRARQMCLVQRPVTMSI